MSKLPSLQFYPGDWLRDPVAGCSLAGQGLWLRLMVLAHDSERYGYLCQNGLPIPFDQLARRCGCSLTEFQTHLAELESAGVPSRTKDGIIFSRRMVRDAEYRQQAADRKRKEREGKKSRSGHGDVTTLSRNRHGPSSSSASSSRKEPPSPLRTAAEVEPLLKAIETAFCLDLSMANGRLASKLSEIVDNLRESDIPGDQLPAEVLSYGIWYNTVYFEGHYPTIDKFAEVWPKYLKSKKTVDIDPYYGKVKYHRAGDKDERPVS